MLAGLEGGGDLLGREGGRQGLGHGGLGGWRRLAGRLGGGCGRGVLGGAGEQEQQGGHGLEDTRPMLFEVLLALGLTAGPGAWALLGQAPSG